MMVPLDVTFRNMPRDERVVADIGRRVRELDAFYDSIISCHVVIDALARSAGAESLYQVRVQLTVPCHEIAIGRWPHQRPTHQDIRVAVGDAFENARAELLRWLHEHPTRTTIETSSQQERSA